MLHDLEHGRSWPRLTHDTPLVREKWEALQFMKWLLISEPSRRPTWQEIINDPYIKTDWEWMAYHPVEVCSFSDKP